MSTVNLLLVPSVFSSNPTWTLEQFHQALIASITTSTTSSNVILGQVGGILPVSNIGPWLNGTTWFSWNGSTYVPATIKVGGATYQVTLAATPTANRTITLPDKDGTLATTDDLNTGRGTTTLSGAGPNMDWSLTGSFALSLTANTTLTVSNSLPGQIVQFAIYNPASWTFTWPASINWSGGVAPTAPASTKTDVHELKNIGGVIYGRSIMGY